VAGPFGCGGVSRVDHGEVADARFTHRKPDTPEHRSASCVAFDTSRRKAFTQAIEGTMATRQQGRIVETPTEARQAEPGPSVLALLTISTGLAVLILGVVWFVFFRT
jgi:hypothetical protein